VTVFENNGKVDVVIKRGGMLDSNIVLNVTTVDGTALG